MKSVKAIALSISLVVLMATSSFATVQTSWSLDTGSPAGGWYNTYLDSTSIPVDPSGIWRASQTGLTTGSYQLSLEGVGRGNWSANPGASTFEVFRTGYTLKTAEGRVGGVVDYSFSNVGPSEFAFKITYNLPNISTATGIYNLSAYAYGESYDIANPAQWKLTSATVSKTPIPAAALLLGSGLAGLFGVTRARKFRGSAA